MPRVTGRVEVFVDGNKLLNKEGATANGIGESGKPTFAREAVMGDTGLHGFTETPQEANVEVNLTDREDVSLSELAALTEATVIFRAAVSGKQYTLKNAFCVGNFSITAGQGETAVKFIGETWSEGTHG